MSEIFIFQNIFHNFFSLKNQLKKHVVSYFCNLQLQYEMFPEMFVIS
jgi:hypothetical protein